MTSEFAQYFDTTSYGWSGAIVIHTLTENPQSSSLNTLPTFIRIDLREWQGTYSDTFTVPVLMEEDFVIPSQEVDDEIYGRNVWVPFIFHYDLPPGEYMWILSTLSDSPCDGTFRVYYETGDQAFPAWLNGATHDNWQSAIYGLETTELYEKVICEGDTFGSSYTASDGLDGIQANTPGGYKKAISIHGQRAYVRISNKKVGCIRGPSHIK